jgi:acyl-CoA synthetase (AMP-forming)/AMP-acid ligase II
MRNLYELVARCNYIHDLERAWTPIELDQLINELDLLLPISRGEIVSFFLPNSLEFVISFFLIAKKNAIANPLNPVYTKPEMEFYLSDVGADIVIVPQSFERMSQLKIICADLNIKMYTISLDDVGFTVKKHFYASSKRCIDQERGDIALFLHTSGTTGRPKLVPISHSNILRTCENITNTLDLQKYDVTYLVMPLFHVHGLIGALLSSLYSHGSVIIPPKFSASNFWNHFVKLNATWFTAVPTILQILLNHSFDGDIGQLRFIRSCSSSLAPVTLQKLQEKFKVAIVEAYAMTEAAHQISSNLRNDVNPGSVGKGRGVEIGIFSLEDDVPLPMNSIGQVCIRGSNVISGYFNNNSANLDSFFTDSSNARWFKTGDLGMIDSNGYLTLKGRLKEMINRAGEKISPLEIDSVLLQHPNVLEAVSFGVPSEVYSQEVEAAVVINKSISEDDLLNFLNGKLAKFKIPKRIYIAKSLPKTPTGKIQRRFVAQVFNKSRL